MRADLTEKEVMKKEPEHEKATDLIFKLWRHKISK
jgi:hypothetical protein